MGMQYENVTIQSFGYALPPNVVTSADIEARLAPLYRALHLKPGQLEAMTGIFERRFWDRGYTMAEGAIAAGKKAIAAAGVSPTDIQMLVYGGVCRDYLEPATACAVADALDLPAESAVYDVSNACLGVVNGMVQTANAIALGQIRAGIVVSCESARQIVESTIERLLADPTMALFKKTVATLTGGSGAVAVVLTDGSLAPGGHRLLGGVHRSAPVHHGLCTWGPDRDASLSGNPVMNTDSVGVLKHGVTLGVSTFQAFRRLLAIDDDKPDKIICHQVGAAHQNTILQAIGIPREKDFTTFRYLGNIGTVSLPITAAIAAERGFLVPGDWVGLLGIGSGLNCIMLGVKW